MADAKELYNQALKSISAGKKQQAMNLLLEAVQEDALYLDAWLKLAEVMPDTEDKYGVLEEILGLDPNNTYANKEWDRLNELADAGGLSVGTEEEDPFADIAPPAEGAGTQDDVFDSFFDDEQDSEVAGEKEDSKPRVQIKRPEMPSVSSLDLETEIVPGITRRDGAMFGGGLLVFTLCMCIFTFTVIGRVQSSRENEAATATAQFLAPQQTLEAGAEIRTETAAAQTQVAINITETAMWTITPSRTSGPQGGFINATAIPDTPTPTEQSFRIAPLAAESVTGTILAWGGRNPASQDFLPLFTYNPRTGERTRIGDDYVAQPSIDSVGSRLMQLRVDTRSRENSLEIVPFNNPTGQATTLNTVLAPQTDIQRPLLASTGNYMVFVGLGDTNTSEVFVYNFLEQTLRQITRDGAQYLEAAISPIGTQVVAVRQEPGGVDLVLINVLEATPDNVPAPIQLTFDANAISESSPRFSTDGNRILYSAGITRTNRDIFVMDMETRTPTALVSSDADEILPIFSPDNRYVLYSANPTGVYNLYILDTIAQLTYQVSEEQRDPVYASGWFQ